MYLPSVLAGIIKIKSLELIKKQQNKLLNVNPWMLSSNSIKLTTRSKEKKNPLNVGLDKLQIVNTCTYKGFSSAFFGCQGLRLRVGGFFSGLLSLKWGPRSLYTPSFTEVLDLDLGSKTKPNRTQSQLPGFCHLTHSGHSFPPAKREQNEATHL